jgi:hypothetical protein
MTIAVMKTTSDPYRTDRLEWPYKSGAKKIIGSVDKVGNQKSNIGYCLLNAGNQFL